MGSLVRVQYRPPNHSCKVSLAGLFRFWIGLVFPSQTEKRLDRQIRYNKLRKFKKHSLQTTHAVDFVQFPNKAKNGIVTDGFHLTAMPLLFV